MSVSQKGGSSVHEEMSVAVDEVGGAEPATKRTSEGPPSAPASDRPPSPRSAKPSSDPQRIGEYLLKRLLGEGGMGRVYEAEERLSKRRVALKVLRDELSKSEQARALFLNEMQILAHLEHPNVVRSLASMEVDGKLCIALELLEGQTLREVLGERERLGWQEAAFVTASVARALAAAHGQEPPVIHRDLKPENIMLLTDGSVKVMDFGIAKLVLALNQTNTQSVGTLQYMSPEQIDARPIDGRTDLYALGLVLYELLTGNPPFRSASPRTLLNMQCTDAPPPLEEAAKNGLPKGIERLMMQLLEKEAGKRPESAREVVERLEPFLPEEGAMSLRGAAGGSAAASAMAERAAAKSAGDTMPSEDVVRERHKSTRAKKSADSDPPKRDARPPKREVKREDTVSLVERASAPRELSTRASLAIIVLLMLIAGAATYFWRASQAEEGKADGKAAADKAAADKAREKGAATAAPAARAPAKPDKP